MPVRLVGNSLDPLFSSQGHARTDDKSTSLILFGIEMILLKIRNMRCKRTILINVSVWLVCLQIKHFLYYDQREGRGQPLIWISIHVLSTDARPSPFLRGHSFRIFLKSCNFDHPMSTGPMFFLFYVFFTLLPPATTAVFRSYLSHLYS